MAGLLLAAAALGFVYSAVPGAVNTQGLRRGLERGFLSALTLQVGALAGDLVWAVLGLSGAAVLFHLLAVRMLLAAGGAAFLLRLAFLTFVEARWGAKPGRGPIRGGDWATGLWFSLANPFGIAFWGGMGGSAASLGDGLPVGLRLAVLLAGFAVGALAWCAGFSALVAYAKRCVGPSLLRGIYVASGLALLYFAGDLLWATWRDVLEWLSVERKAAV
jgi:chemosensory pili system protein ChpE